MSEHISNISSYCCKNAGRQQSLIEQKKIVDEIFQSQVMCSCGCQNCEKKVIDDNKKFGVGTRRKNDPSSGCQVHPRVNMYCKDCKTPNQLPEKSQALLSRNGDSSDAGSIVGSTKNFQMTYANFGHTNLASSKPNQIYRDNSGYDLQKIMDRDFKDDEDEID